MKTLGIWGLGVVGQSVVRYCINHSIPFTILNNNPLSDQQKTFLADHQLTCVTNTSDITHFLAAHETILVSAGIDLRPYREYAHKCIGELDFFAQYWHKKIVAITGTVGKTTITHLLGSFLQSQGVKAAIAGNIGVGLCDLLDNQDAYDIAILEVSSFQLELAHTFAADLAIWTNFYPNHLDRHTSLDEYFHAKEKILTLQRSGQLALIPHALKHTVSKNIPSNIYYFSDKTAQDIPPLFYEGSSSDSVNHNFWGERYASIMLQSAPASIIFENWIIIAGALCLLGNENMLEKAAEFIKTAPRPPHRVEYVCTKNGRLFYNDSKGTTPIATRAALDQLKNYKIILLLGGVSKGIDRTPFLRELPAHVQHVVFFGKEAQPLADACTHTSYSVHQTLEDAVEHAYKKSAPGDIILLSPAGASFDLFSSYVERGNQFKEIVLHSLKDV